MGMQIKFRKAEEKDTALDWNAPSIRFYKSLGAEAMTDWTVYRLAGEALKKMA